MIMYRSSIDSAKVQLLWVISGICAPCTHQWTSHICVLVTLSRNLCYLRQTHIISKAEQSMIIKTIILMYFTFVFFQKMYFGRNILLMISSYKTGHTQHLKNTGNFLKSLILIPDCFGLSSQMAALSKSGERGLKHRKLCFSLT